MPDVAIPTDDGACAHLTGTTLPAIALPPSSDPSHAITLSKLPGVTALFAYPHRRSTGPVTAAQTEAWSAIPGASGCTAQTCAFRDQLAELKAAGVQHVFGLTVQDSEYQREAQVKSKLPYDLLSDAKLEFATALKLPTFEWEGGKLLNRVAMVVKDGKIVKVFYPVYPPGESASQIVEWLGGAEGKKAVA